MRKRCALAVMLIALAGCKSKPIYHGPNYPLNEFPDKAAAGPVAIEVVDARPFWEKRYYEGATAFVPMENLRPSPLPLFIEEIQREAQNVSTPPTRVVVKLNSFRVVMRHSAETEHEMEIEKEQDERLEADSSEFTSIVIEDIARGLAHLCRRGFEEWGQKERHLKGPPRGLDGDYPLGVSCDIRAVATLEWPNGRHRDVPLRAVTNSEELATRSAAQFGRNNDVSLTVQSACAQIAAEWKERTLHPVASNGDAHVPPVPQFTAYGNGR